MSREGKEERKGEEGGGSGEVEMREGRMGEGDGQRGKEERGMGRGERGKLRDKGVEKYVMENCNPGDFIKSSNLQFFLAR
jgi:hypothetical protein